MKASILSLSVATLALFGLCSCGSISSVEPATGKPLDGGGSYDSLVVKPFRDATAPDGFSEWTADEQSEYRAAVKSSGERIARTIISKAKSASRFGHVGEKMGPGKNLVIDGEINRYNDGVASLRMFIGMGAGSSYLDGVAYFRDGSSGRELGKVVVDKNSWPLGGGIAAMQTVERFAEAAAEKIAQESLGFAR